MRTETGGSSISGAYDNPATWLKAAKAHEAQGDLQRALYEYRLAKTVGLSDRIVHKHLRRVESKIEQRITTLNRQAERAETRGHERAARNHYLEILALQPDNNEALEALRKLDRSAALRGTKHAQELAGRARYGSRKKQLRKSEQNEGYADSRQAILDGAKPPNDIGRLLQELERHQRKYPKDNTLRQHLIETSLVQAEQAYKAKQWDDALYYLNLAEQAGKGTGAYGKSVSKARKDYARKLYDQGVITYRTEPRSALNYWNYALRFDPDDDKSRLRIRSMSAQ
ncbi:MAG: hypothetical protein P8103_14675 [Candidatus Thiodiazotropha sp.]